MESAYGVSPLDPKQFESVPIALSVFHTSFNILNTIILIGFVNRLAQFATRLVPAPDGTEAEFHLQHLKNLPMPTPELSIIEAQKEVEQFGRICLASFKRAVSLLDAQKKKKFRLSMQKISEYEKLSDTIELELARYLIMVSRNELTEESSRKIKSMFSIINDLESICDIHYQMAKRIEKRSSGKQFFSDDQIARLKELFRFVQLGFEEMQSNLELEYSRVRKEDMASIHTKIIHTYQKMRKKHIQDMEKGRCRGDRCVLYNDILLACHKLAAHLSNVNVAICGD